MSSPSSSSQRWNSGSGSESDSDSSSEDPTPSLTDKVEAACIESHFDVRRCYFLPEGKLDELITDEIIHTELPIDSKDDSLIRQINSQGKKLFAIMTSLGVADRSGPGKILKKQLKKLFKAGFTDANLPVEQPPKSDEKLRHRLADIDPNFWNWARIHKFAQQQWKYLAPVFKFATKDEYNVDLQSSHILPFVEKYEEGGACGSFGQVNKFKIHPAHRDGWNDTYVAVKKIQPQTENDRKKMVIEWGKEASVLQQMNSLGQDHIIRFITAFRRGDKGSEDHYLMFEWADGGNLRNLWQELIPVPSLVRETVHQILGLACAIAEAHDENSPKHLGTNFRHGDLKPENILWFKTQDPDSIMGTLKIGDWGLAKGHDNVTELRSNRSTTNYGTRRYEPPEVVTGLDIAQRLDPQNASKKPGNQPEKRRSRLYDLWAMGCITFEFIVWLLYGPGGLTKFNKDLNQHSSGGQCTFYEVKKQSPNGKIVAQVHPRVIAWMDHMAKDPACQVGTTALGSLLELVRDKLLVVKLPERGATSSFSTLRSARSGMSRRSSVSTLNSEPDREGLPSMTISPPDDGTQPSSDYHDKTSNDLTVPGIIVSEPGEAPPRATSRPGPKPLSGAGPERATAPEFVQIMEDIAIDHPEESYWYTEVSERRFPDGFRCDKAAYHSTYATEGSIGSSSRPLTGGTLQPPGMRAHGGGLVVPATTRVDYGNTSLVEDWELRIDNEFAMRISHSIKALAERPGYSTTSMASLTKSLSTLSHSSTKSLTGQTRLLEDTTLHVNTSKQHPLCEACRAVRDGIWNPGFAKTYQISSLKERAKAKSCDLCGLMWRACERFELNRQMHANARFERVGSFFKLNDILTPALSIFRSPDLKTRSDHEIQIGFGNLPEPDTEACFEIIKQWLVHCDDRHGNSICRPHVHGSKSVRDTAITVGNLLPARVIEVGLRDDPYVRLTETGPCDTGEWIALSHQWGPDPHFCTTKENLTTHLNGIEVDQLPATFQDAVKITRYLGKRYLWIDSLCIVQGAGGDFNQQAKRMEQVYSGAYCVLAASRGVGHSAGFLKPRKKRDYVALHQGTGEGTAAPFYISENIDDFNSHVLEGDLNQRGWVFQEHALARRTVFFTEYQMYFECGDGVRCETMMGLKNDLAAFLGDPCFPQILENAKQGERIQRYQDLYRRYSRLGLTNDCDRPLAIDGLQSRILTTLGISGGFGIFDEGERKKGMLRRSLLWIRGKDTECLKKIVFPRDRAISVVPSWSWMAYTGGIDYLSDPDEFGGIEWEVLQSPWWSAPISGGLSPGSPHGHSNLGLGVVQSPGQLPRANSELQGGNIALVAKATQYDLSCLSPDEKGELIWDTPGQSEQPETLCVVLGRVKLYQPGSSTITNGQIRTKAQQMHYLLLVKPTSARDRRGDKIYERVGAGYLPGKCIAQNGAMVSIH